MFSSQTYEVIRQRILDKFPNLLNKREGSYSSNLISPTSVELAKAYINMGDILSLGFIETNFDSFLDRRVNELGVYRKQGKKAHGQIKVTGVEETKIENGTIVSYNNLRYLVLNDIVLPDTDVLEVEALEVGVIYNVIKGTNFELIETNSNIKSLIALNDFVGGIDIETDEELRKRFVKSMDNPSTSGNKAHYEEWALEVSGVERAIVTPLWNGNGTVKVLAIGNNNKPLSSEIVEEVKLHIMENMPIGVNLTVVTPTVLDIHLVASVKLINGYTIEDVKKSLEVEINLYLKDVTNLFVYSKVYGLLANLDSVEDVISLSVNGTTSNISISSDKIPNINTINISEVVA